MRRTVLLFLGLVLTVSTGCSAPSSNQTVSTQPSPIGTSTARREGNSNIGPRSSPTIAPVPSPATNVLQDPKAISSFLEDMSNQSNSLIVERDYLGRLIETKGAVNSVGYGDGGLIYVVIDPQIKVNWPKMFGEAPTIFHYGFDESYKDRLADISQGDIVTLRGKLSNFNKTPGELNYRAVLRESEVR